MDSCTFHYYRPMQAIQSATECLLTLRGKGEKKRKFDWTPEERAECKLVLASAEHEIRALPWQRDAITERRAHAEPSQPPVDDMSLALPHAEPPQPPVDDMSLALQDTESLQPTMHNTFLQRWRPESIEEEERWMQLMSKFCSVCCMDIPEGDHHVCSGKRPNHTPQGISFFSGIGAMCTAMVQVRS